MEAVVACSEPLWGVMTHPPAAECTVWVLADHRTPHQALTTEGNCLAQGHVLSQVHWTPMTGWCRNTEARFPCFNFSHVWKVIPAPELSIRSAEADGRSASPSAQSWLLHDPTDVSINLLHTALHLKVCSQESLAKESNYPCAASKK